MSNSKKSEKLFDCVEFKRQAQLRIYEKIKDMSPAEEIEYFRRQAESGPFADLIGRIEASRHRPAVEQDRKRGQVPMP